MSERDQRIIDHIVRYRLTFRSVLAEILFDRRSPANVIRRLIESGRIQSRAGLPERLRYYQLTPQETRRAGVPAARARPFGPQALQAHIMLLWYCCVSPGRHRRLEAIELERLFGPAFPPGPHCLCEGADPSVWRVYATGPRTNDRSLVKQIDATVSRLLRHDVIGPCLRAGRYGVVILAESPGRRTRIMELIDRHGITQRTHTRVAYAPSHRTTAAALRERLAS